MSRYNNSGSNKKQLTLLTEQRSTNCCVLCSMNRSYTHTMYLRQLINRVWNYLLRIKWNSTNILCVQVYYVCMCIVCTRTSMYVYMYASVCVCVCVCVCMYVCVCMRYYGQLQFHTSNTAVTRNDNAVSEKRII